MTREEFTPACVNVKNKYGDTLLMLAAWYGRKDIVEYLKSKGAKE